MSQISTAFLSKLRARIAEIRASQTPLCILLDPGEGSQPGERAARALDANRRAEACKATGRRACILVIDGVETAP